MAKRVVRGRLVWSGCGMVLGESKIVKALAGAGALGAVLLVCGCSASHPTAMWSARPVFNEAAGGATMGSSSSVVFSPGVDGNAVALGASGPGFDRNDGLMSVRDVSRRDELLGLPEAYAPTLDRRRVFRGARRADEYVYPGEPGYRDRGYRGYQGYRGYRRHHGGH